MLVMTRTRIGWIAAVLALVWALSSPARGTTFVLMDEATLFDSSDAVIVGTVTDVESAVPNPTGPVYTYIHVDVEQVIKGALGQQPVVLREPGGTFGERHEWIYGAPEFSVGERSLLFLSRTADGVLQTNMKNSAGKIVVATTMMTRGGGHAEKEIPEIISE